MKALLGCTNWKIPMREVKAVTFMSTGAALAASPTMRRILAVGAAISDSRVMSTPAVVRVSVAFCKGIPRRRWRISLRSISVAMSQDSPSLPARPVRPIRWMYCSRLGGRCMLITWVTLGKSIPLAVTSEEIRMPDVQVLKLSAARVRCACVSLEWISYVRAGASG